MPQGGQTGPAGVQRLRISDDSARVTRVMVPGHLQPERSTMNQIVLALAAVRALLMAGGANAKNHSHHGIVRPADVIPPFGLRPMDAIPPFG